MCPAEKALPPSQLAAWAWEPSKHLPIFLLCWMGSQALGGGWGPRRAPHPSSSSAPGSWSHGKLVQRDDGPAAARRPPGEAPHPRELRGGAARGCGVLGCHHRAGIWGAGRLLSPESTRTGFSSPVLHFHGNDDQVSPPPWEVRGARTWSLNENPSISQNGASAELWAGVWPDCELPAPLLSAPWTTVA